MILGLLVIAPFVTGLVTAFTLGYGGAGGSILVAILAMKLDITPKLPKRKPLPLPNVSQVQI